MSTTVAPAAAMPRMARVWAALGYAAIWLFLIVFLVYPLLRIFYDAFSDEAGRFKIGRASCRERV